MPRRVEVFGRVFIFASVAATYVPADEALAEVDPGVAHLEALLVALRRGLYVPDPV